MNHLIFFSFLAIINQIGAYNSEGILKVFCIIAFLLCTTVVFIEYHKSK